MLQLAAMTSPAAAWLAGGQSLLLAALLVVGCLGPGLLLVRRLDWSPLEKLCTAVAVSITLLYLSAMGIYVAGLPWACTWGVSLLAAAGLAAGWRQLLDLWRDHDVRRSLQAFALLLAWTLLHLALVRHYSGSWWAADWIEHYQRAQFYLQRQPLETMFLDIYLLPARPPLMNLVAAHFLAQVGDDFWLYQIVMTSLNTLAILPCVLIATRLGAARRPMLLITLAFMCNPTFMHNASYAWPRLLTAYYVVLGLDLYLAGWKAGCSRRLLAAFLAMSAGMLAHYSAGPFALFLGLHYLAVVFPRAPRRWRQAAAIGLACTLLLATWVAWSSAHYGFKGTVATNTTVTDTARFTFAQNVYKVGENLFFTLVPHTLRIDGQRFRAAFNQPSELGFWRDYTFTLYQSNLPFVAGALGLVLLIAVVARVGRGATTGFWVAMVVFNVIVGVAVHGPRDVLGLAHVCLQPLTLLAITAIAAHLPDLARPLQVAALLGWLLDFIVGVLLHFQMQQRTFPSDSLGYPLYPGQMLNVVAVDQWTLKTRHGWTFLGDLLAWAAAPVQVAIVLLLAVLLALAARRLWRGAAGGVGIAGGGVGGAEGSDPSALFSARPRGGP